MTKQRFKVGDWVYYLRCPYIAYGQIKKHWMTRERHTYKISHFVRHEDEMMRNEKEAKQKADLLVKIYHLRLYGAIEHKEQKGVNL